MLRYLTSSVRIYVFNGFKLLNLFLKNISFLLKFFDVLLLSFFREGLLGYLMKSSWN